MDIKPSYSCLFRLNYITHSHNSDFKCSCLHKSAHPSTSLDPQQIRKMLLFYLTYTGIQRLVKIAALEKPFTINPNYTREYKETANWDAWAFLCINLSLWQVKSVNPCRHDAFMGQRFSKYDSQADVPATFLRIHLGSVMNTTDLLFSVLVAQPSNNDLCITFISVSPTRLADSNRAV